MDAAMRFLDWLRLIRQIRQWFQRASELLDLPDLDDAGEVYGWCYSVLSLARESVKLTPTQVDDRVVTWLLDGPFASFESFQPLYKLFRAVLELIDGDESDETIATKALAAAGDDAVARLSGNTVGVEPITLIAIIVQVIRIILELKRK